MKFLSTALLCTLLYLSEAYEFGETVCSSTNGTGVVFRLTGRGLTYGENKHNVDCTLFYFIASYFYRSEYELFGRCRIEFRYILIS